MNLSVKQTVLDKVISHFNPIKGKERYHARAQMAVASSALSPSGYDQPGQKSRRFLQPFDLSANSPDSDILDKKEGSIAISRDAWMNNSIAVAMLKRVKTTTIGTGLKLQSQIDSEFLGLEADDARTWQKNTERKFRTWAESKDCDITRQQNFYELQDLAFFSVLLSGDVFALFPNKSIRSQTSSVRVRLIEADLCSNPNFYPDQMSGRNLAAGVELDKSGAPKKYWFSKQYPGANLLMMSADSWVGVPAFSRSGKKQVHHMFFKDRPGQRRGMPLLSNVINELMKVSKLKDAELTAHVVSSLFTVFIKDMAGFSDQLQEGEAGDMYATAQKEANIAPDDTTKLGLGTGVIHYLDDTKEIQVAEGRKIGDSFQEFYTSFVKELSAAIELPYEQLLLHFSASYSASRGALLEAWKAVRVRRAWVSINFCQPAFQAWLDEEIAERRILAPGFFEDPETRAAWSKTSWAGMGNGQLDPIKETKAAVMRIQNNLSNHEKEYSQIQDDGDWEGTIHRRRDEQDLIEKLDLLPVATTEESTQVADEVTNKSESTDDDDELQERRQDKDKE